MFVARYLPMAAKTAPANKLSAPSSPDEEEEPSPSLAEAAAAGGKTPTKDDAHDNTTAGGDFEHEAKSADFQIVAAIDFGTTFSGYAYSFASSREAVHVNKNWGQTQVGC